MSETENMLSAYGSLLDVAATNNAAIRDNALEGAKLTRGRGAVYLAGQAGGMLMQNLASMAGMKTIGEERQETIESILDANRHLDPNDPKSLFTIGKQFSDVGFTGIAQKFLERGRKLDLEQYKAETERGKMTASLQTAATGGQVKEGTIQLVGAGDAYPGMMKTMIWENAKYVDLINPETDLPYMQLQHKPDAAETFEKKIEYIKGLTGTIDPTTNLPYTDSTINRMIASILEGGSGVNITFTGDDAYANELGKILAIDDQKLVKDSERAVQQIKDTNYVLRLINKGDANIGAFSTIEQSFDRVKSELGSAEGEEAAGDTQLLNALLGKDVFPLIKQLGIGARGLDTPAERNFLQAVFVGTINMEGAALEQLTRLRQKYSTMIIQDFNNKVKTKNADGVGYFSRYEKVATRTLEEIEIPKMVRPEQKKYNVPDGQGGTVEEVYPAIYPVLDDDGGETGALVYQYRPDGPMYDERGIDVTDQYPEVEVKYVEAN